jgi:pimeloyl-ACP methyl ester carboxylesterase
MPYRVVAVFSIAIAALAGCAGLDEQQRRWIFQPSNDTWGGALAAADGMQDVWIRFRSEATGADANLHGLWLPQRDAQAPVLLYLHGARWNVRSSAARMRRMHGLGFAVLAIDYRGFGLSDAALPSEALATEDALAAWQWLVREQPQAQRRFIFGHSLGGGVAVRLATQVGDTDGLILEGTFTSIPELVGSMKWGWLPLGPLITQRFDSASRIADVSAPVLVVHGSDDRLVPPALGRALYERARGPKRFVLVEGGSHHDTNAVGTAHYRAALRELFGLAP